MSMLQLEVVTPDKTVVSAQVEMAVCPGVPKLAHEDILTYEEFLRLAALFAQCGICLLYTSRCV